jgi:hypothetical protein
MPADKPQPVRSPGALALGDALGQSQPLTLLLQRLHESQARLASLRDRLPDALRDQVRAGPLDEAGWSLLVPNGATAAKLRHLLPELEAALRQQGWPALALRIRIQAR